MGQFGRLFLVLLVIGLQSTFLLSRPFAQEPTKAPSDAEVDALRAQLDVRQKEVERLEAQLDLMRSYDQRLLNTVNWSIDVLIGITVILLGFAWFANFRVYERDKATLTQDLRIFTQNQLAEIRSQLEGEMRERHSELLKEMHRAASAAVEPLQEEVNRIQDYSKRFKCEFFRLEARHWITEKSWVDALSAYTDALNLALTLNETYYYISNILSGIHSMLEANSRENPAVKPSVTYRFSELEKVLEKVPSEHSEVVEPIRALLVEMKGRPGVMLPPIFYR